MSYLGKHDIISIFKIIDNHYFRQLHRERTSVYVLWVSMLPLSTIFLMEFGVVLTMSYFAFVFPLITNC